MWKDVVWNLGFVAFSEELYCNDYGFPLTLSASARQWWKNMKMWLKIGIKTINKKTFPSFYVQIMCWKERMPVSFPFMELINVASWDLGMLVQHSPISPRPPDGKHVFLCSVKLCIWGRMKDIKIGGNNNPLDSMDNSLFLSEKGAKLVTTYYYAEFSL